MTMSIAVHLSLLFDSSFNRKHAAIGLIMSIFVTLMSTSKSGLVIFIALIGAIMLLRSLRWKNLIMVMIFSLLFGISVPGITVIFGNWDFLMVDVLDKDPTISGRTDIWAYAAEMLEREERTLFGYGRAVFWDPSLPYSKGAGDRVMGVTTLYSKAEYNPPNAHNGWVDMMLEVGYVGVALMVMSLSLFIARALRRVYITTTPEEFGPLAFIFFFLFYNMTESLMLRSETIFWMTYISFAYGIRLGGQEEIPDHPPLHTQRTAKRKPKRLQAQAPSIARWRYSKEKEG
jgi:O-antigen ligase